MQDEIPKNENKMGSAATEEGRNVLARQREGVENYLEEIEQLSGEVDTLQGKKD